MTDDRSLERAARSWLESGPAEAPDRAVEAALLRIQTTRQDRVIPALWRLPTMNALGRMFAGLVAVAILAVAGLVALRPSVGSGAPTVSPSPGAGPSANPSAELSPSEALTPQVAACGLVTTSEAAEFGPYGPGTGASSAGFGSGAVTGCRYTSGDIALTVTLTNPGGKAAFDLVKATPEATAIPDLGADRGGGQLGADGVFDPASVTLYVSKGDALVAIVVGSGAQSSESRLADETTVARLILPRM